MNEQGRLLPSGILLPELRFSKPEQQNNVLIQQSLFQNNEQHYQQIQNRQHYCNNQGGDVNMELDNVDEEMYDKFEESENGQCCVQIEELWNDSQEEGDYQSKYVMM